MQCRYKQKKEKKSRKASKGRDSNRYWSRKEDKILYQAVTNYVPTGGNKWDTISKLLPGRSPGSLRMRYSYIEKFFSRSEPETQTEKQDKKAGAVENESKPNDTTNFVCTDNAVHERSEDDSVSEKKRSGTRSSSHDVARNDKKS